MTRPIAALVPVALAAVVLTSATTLTFAAVRQGSPKAKLAPAVAARKTAVVPDVRGQAYVFAKGILEDAGFAWKVRGAVKAYAVNTVTAQSPAGGTILVDTGAPTVSLTLLRNSAYREVGTPEDSSPYAGTAVLLPSQVGKARVKAKAVSKPAAAPKPPPRPAARLTPGLVPAAAVKPKPAASPVPAAHSATSSFRGGKAPHARPPAFAAQGAPREPLDEMPLPDRARSLDAWLTKHPKDTPANERHWLYQHAWLVYGAKFGWWHGAEALRLLVKVDQRVESLWGVGAQSEAEARQALALVEQKSR